MAKVHPIFEDIMAAHMTPFWKPKSRTGSNFITVDLLGAIHDVTAAIDWTHDGDCYRVDDITLIDDCGENDRTIFERSTDPVEAALYRHLESKALERARGEGW